MALKMISIHIFIATTTALAALPSSLPLRPTGVITGAHVRYCYEGGTFRRDGRLLPLDDECTSGAQVLAALEADGADLSRFSARAYDDELSGWAPLTADTIFDDADSSSRRVDVQLFRKTPPPARSDFDGEQAAAAGYFNIGVVGAKHSHNLGSLWRSAYQLGAAGVFVVADRGAVNDLHKEASDTTKAWRRIPMWRHDDWNAFCESQPFGAVLVAVEMGGEASLEEFEHPERAVYLLGAEDTGLPESVVRAAHRHVTLPCERYESFNVAVAGAMVMYDRLAKTRMKQSEQERDAAKPAAKQLKRANLYVSRKDGRPSRRPRRLR